MTIFVELSEVSKNFGTFNALAGVSAKISKGSILGLVGDNGAGKTTLLRSIASLSVISTGFIQINGCSAQLFPRSKISFLPEERGLFQEESLFEQCRYLAFLKGMRAGFQEQFAHLISRLDLSGKENIKVKNLSLGNQQRAQWLIALINNPELLLLDEPFNGLDFTSVQLVSEILIELSHAGTTIIISSHQLALIDDLASEIMLIREGQLVRHVRRSEIKESQLSIGDIYFA
jgi:ABC-2 type transport system ATP-binding protein